MTEDFSLSPPDGRVRSHSVGGARPGSGRPPGRKNKTSSVLWRQAQIASPEIQRQWIDEAQKLGHYLHVGDVKRARFAFEAGLEILNRTWRPPRSAPMVEIDLRNNATLEAALVDGDLTPSDYAALTRAHSQNTLGSGPIGPPVDARKNLADKLAALIRNRQRWNGSSPEEEPIITPPPAAAAGNGVDDETRDIIDREVRAAINGLDADRLIALADELER